MGTAPSWRDPPIVRCQGRAVGGVTVVQGVPVSGGGYRSLRAAVPPVHPLAARRRGADVGTGRRGHVRDDPSVVGHVRPRLRPPAPSPPPLPGDTWHRYEAFVKIQGAQKYLWRAVNQDGNVLDMLVQSLRDTAAVPQVIVTDKLRSYGAALWTRSMPSILSPWRVGRARREPPPSSVSSLDFATRHLDFFPSPGRSPTVPGNLQPHLPALPTTPSPTHHQ